MQTIKSCASALTALAAIGLLALPGHSQEGRGPFVGLSGPWTGNGQIMMNNGTKERIRCRAKYSTSPSGTQLHQELRCASDSYKFEVISNVVSDASGKIAGTWSETSRNVTGDVSGSAAGGNVHTRVQGSSFSANLDVRLQGDRQIVSIIPQGVDVKQVSVTLERG
jgi:hypothetical protein